jgi:malate synthase
LQAQIDAWHARNAGRPHDAAAYEGFLREIGYLLPASAAVAIATGAVDDEIARIAGPQLVVPSSNARYALNAANARWGSLYDALYGTDAIAEDGDAERGKGFNPVRGARVIAKARAVLDAAAPLAIGTHADAAGYSVQDGALVVTLKDGAYASLKAPTQFAGFTSEASAPKSVLLVNNGLHIELVIDRSSAIGSSDPAGLSDVVLESASFGTCFLPRLDSISHHLPGNVHVDNGHGKQLFVCAQKAPLLGMMDVLKSKSVDGLIDAQKAHVRNVLRETCKSDFDFFSDHISTDIMLLHTHGI